MLQAGIYAIGRLRTGPEKLLVDEYMARFCTTGRPFGLAGAVHEIDNRKASDPMSEEKLLVRALPDNATRIALDERGKCLSSPDFAKLLASLRDDGIQEVAFLIGGADGLTQKLRDQAQYRISFGPMVWPHMLARIMLTEQLYRAASILANTPYHRA